MKTCHPDYDRSILALASSIFTHFTGEVYHKTLPELDAELSLGYKNIVLMLFDGMGVEILERHLPKDSFLRSNLITEISSVFPPTTTAATTSVLTAKSPVEHGWLGWSLYFEEIGANVSVFPNTLSGSGGVPAADYHVGHRYLPYTRIIEKINAAEKAKAYTVWPFGEPKVTSVREMCDNIERLCRESGRKYIYAYWTMPDEDMHVLGTSHAAIKKHMRVIEQEVKRLCGRLSDTLIVLTADHGMTDVAWRFLHDHPEVVRCLERTPWMEPRAMAFAVKPGLGREFERAFESAFGDCFMLFSREQAKEMGLFGPGTPNQRADNLIGDYIAAATGDVAIEVSAPQGDMMRAHHAGLTDSEMRIPLIVVRT